MVREAGYAGAAPANGPAFLPPSAPAINGPPGPMQPPAGMYPRGAAVRSAASRSASIAGPGPQFQDAMQLQPPVPAVGPAAPPAGNIPPEDQSLVPAGTNSASRLLDHLEVNVVARGYYRNDQRIEWSGMEDTFGGEADIASRLRQRCGDFEFVIDSEFFINEPYGRNQLLNRSGTEIVCGQFSNRTSSRCRNSRW